MAAKDNERIRVSLDVTPQIRDQLEDLKVRSNATNLTEVFRRALAAYDMLVEHQANKGKVILQNADGTQESVRLL